MVNVSLEGFNIGKTVNNVQFGCYLGLKYKCYEKVRVRCYNRSTDTNIIGCAVEVKGSGKTEKLGTFEDCILTFPYKST